MTTTEQPTTGGFVVGEQTTYVVGLKGTVDEIGDGTITIGGITVPTRLQGPDGPVLHLSTQWPADFAAQYAEMVGQVRHGREVLEREVVSLGEDIDTLTKEQQELLDAIARLHEENHPGVLSVCLHDVCRRWGR